MGQDGKTPEKRVYSVEEVAVMLDIGIASAYKAARAGLFPVVDVGTVSIRIPKDAFDEWLRTIAPKAIKEAV